MTALSGDERTVAWVLYQHGGGTLLRDDFERLLDVDPVAQVVARRTTPILERLVVELLSPSQDAIA